MKAFVTVTAFAAASLLTPRLMAQPDKMGTLPGTVSAAGKNLYIDVHHLGKGNVTYDAVAKAHIKDLAVEGKYGVHLYKFWVDEEHGDVYCLSSSADTQSIRHMHAEAHGLLPAEYYLVTGGREALAGGASDFYLDVHEFGPGKVTAKDVAGAHKKDLAVEKKYGVNFINYWVDEKQGRVMCLSQAPDSSAVIKTHAEAHGLLPLYIVKVEPGQ